MSASGPVRVAGHTHRTARDSLPQGGIHDAELVERVWEHDLRVEGMVVEPRRGSTTCPAGSPSPAPYRADGSACWSTTSWPTEGAASSTA